MVENNELVSEVLKFLSTLTPTENPILTDEEEDNETLKPLDFNEEHIC